MVHELDQISTPASVAARMIRLARIEQPEVVADFAVGEGSLLIAAQRKWADCECVGTDIDRNQVGRLRRANPCWNVGVADFLKRRSRTQSDILRKYVAKVDLAVLNPPFSYRGARQWCATIGGRDIRCSQALAFIAEAIGYLSERGEIVAVMPTGSLVSEKDEVGWSVIRSLFRVTVYDIYGRHAFRGCVPRTAIVRMVRYYGNEEHARRPRSKKSEYVHIKSGGLVRGSLQMHNLPKPTPNTKLALVHTTNLVRGRVYVNGMQVGATTSTLKGPAVLFPRVGRPTPSKVCVLRGKGQVALSDCILALPCSSIKEAQEIRKLIVSRWKDVESAYGGTGAPYITIRNAHAVLHRLGVVVSRRTARVQKGGVTDPKKTTPSQPLALPDSGL